MLACFVVKKGSRSWYWSGTRSFRLDQSTIPGIAASKYVAVPDDFVNFCNAVRVTTAIRFSLVGQVFADRVKLVLFGIQCAWQNPDEKLIVFRDQSIIGLCHHSQLFPRIIFRPASFIT